MGKKNKGISGRKLFPPLNIIIYNQLVVAKERTSSSNKPPLILSLVAENIYRRYLYQYRQPLTAANSIQYRR